MHYSFDEKKNSTLKKGGGGYMGFFQNMKNKREAKKLGLSLEQYLEFVRFHEETGKGLGAFSHHLKAKKNGLSDEAYTRYLNYFSKKYDIEQYKTFLQAEKIGMDLPQYYEYQRNYADSMKPDEFLLFYEVRKIGISLKEYNLYKKKFEEKYKNFNVEQFQVFLDGEAMGMTLAEYQEIHEAQRLHMTLDEFRAKKRADALGITPSELKRYDALVKLNEEGKSYVLAQLSDSELRLLKVAGLRRITLHYSVKSIPEKAFSGYSNLSEITLPQGLEQIGRYAFENCTSLKKITFPGSISVIPRGVLDGCTGLQHIELLTGIRKVDITGWAELPKLESVMSAVSIREFIVDTTQDYLCFEAYHQTIRESDYSSASPQFSISKQKYIEVLEIKDTSYTHSSYFFLNNFPNLKTLIVNRNCSFHIENCPKLHTLLYRDGSVANHEYYKNGNIKKERYSSHLNLPKDVPIRFFLVEWFSYDDWVSVLGKRRIGSEKGAGEFLKWLHVPLNTSVDISESSCYLRTANSADVQVKKSKFLTVNENYRSDPSVKLEGCQEGNAEVCIFKHYANLSNSSSYYFRKTMMFRRLTILYGIQSIEPNSFSNLNMKEVYIPDSVSSIGSHAFSGCIYLRKVIFEGIPQNCASDAFTGSPVKELVLPDQKKELEVAASFGIVLDKSQITRIDLSGMMDIPPSYAEGAGIEEIIIPPSVKEIGYRAFACCYNLKRIIFQGSPSKIADDAFEDCPEVDYIYWGKNTHYRIAGNTGFPNIHQVTIDESVTTIPDGAFENWGLTSIHLPAHVKAIEEGAFAGCWFLTRINSDEEGIAVIPANCKISPLAFDGCGFHTVYFEAPDITQQIDAACTGNVETVYISHRISFASFALLAECESLKTVKLLKDSTSVKENDIILNIPDFSLPKTLTHLEFPDCVNFINHELLKNCTELWHISIPDNAIYIAPDAFTHCAKLRAKIALSDALMKLLLSKPGGADAIRTKDSKSGNTYPTELVIDGESAALPAGISERAKMCITKIVLKCKTIPANTFRNMLNLREVECNAKLETIGASAFEGCVSLRELILPDAVTSIGSAAFKGCTFLQEIRIPRNLTVLPKEMLKDCARLETVAGIQAAFHLKEIGASAFSGCKSICEILIPDSITSIGEAAFERCISLRHIHIPSGVERLPQNVFEGCKQLETVEGMLGTCYVEENAFAHCTSLKEMVFSREIFSIKNAFMECNSLKRIVIPVDIAEFDVDLRWCKNLTELFLPQEIDTFRCLIPTPNSITVYAYRGSSWKNQFSPSSVNYLRKADYEAMIQDILMEKHLLTQPTGKFPDESRAEPPIRTKTNPSAPTAPTKPKIARASWKVQSKSSEGETVFSNGSSTVDELLEKLQKNSNANTSYSLESVERAGGNGSVKPQGQASCFANSTEDTVITGNIFTVSYNRTLPSDAIIQLYILLVDENGASLSDMKRVIIAPEANQISVQLELLSGVQNGTAHLISASGNPIENVVLTDDTFRIDIAFSMDFGFDF